MGILSGLVIAITGTLPAEPCNIKKWVEANGGKWSARVAKHVTHLITGKDAWKNATDTVIQAAELGILIVSWDWLEDSLQGKRKLAEKKYTWEVIKKDKKRMRELKKLGALADGKKFVEGCQRIRELTGSGTSQKLPPVRKAKPSKSHFFAATINTKFVSATDDLKRRRAEREAAEAAEKAAKVAKKALLSASATAHAPIEIEDGTTASGSVLTPPASVSPVRATSMNSTSSSTANVSTIVDPQAKKPSLKDLYHYYLDSTGFEYKITLARSNFTQNNITRYQISILESHATPHTYCTFVQYNPPIGRRPDESTIGTNSVTTTNLRNPLLSFLRHSNDTEKKNNSASADVKPEARSPPQSPIQLAAAEATRLRSLITPPTPCSSLPYKSLITPISSPFPTAWRAFRHTFRDCTLLSWEERFDRTKTMQTARAQILGIEPYMYAKPAMGMPMGLMVQEAGLGQGDVGGAGGVTILGDAADGYVRNEYGLPGVEEPLGRQGVVGMGIWRAEEERRKVAEREERRREEGEEEMRRARGEAKAKRVNYNRPLFNCVTGRPT